MLQIRDGVRAGWGGDREEEAEAEDVLSGNVEEVRERARMEKGKCSEAQKGGQR